MFDGFERGGADESNIIAVMSGVVVGPDLFCFGLIVKGMVGKLALPRDRRL